MHKAQHFIEVLVIFLTIKWQPIFGVLTSIIACVFYIGMIKLNIVDKKFAGSWKEYFKSLKNYLPFKKNKK